MDELDKHIVEFLKENSRQNFKVIGEKVHMTGQAVGNRVRKLEDQGIIEGYTLRLNTEGQGLILAYIMLFMKSNDHYRVKQFFKDTREIVEAFRISGEGCYLLQVEAKNYENLNQLCEEILKFANYRLNIVTERIK